MSSIKDIKIEPVKIVLDKERHLIYTLDAIAKVEGYYDTFGEAIDKALRGSISALIVLLWAGLSAEDETLTVEQIGKMLYLKDRERVQEAVLKALKLSFGEDITEEKTEDEGDEKGKN